MTSPLNAKIARAWATLQSQKGYSSMYKNNKSSLKKPQGTISNSIPSDSNLADRWINQYPLTIWYNKKFYRPNDDSVYVVVSRDSIALEILQIMKAASPEGYRPTAKRMYSVLELARVEIAVTKENFIMAAVKNE